MFFEENYKMICIIGYVLAALGSIVGAALEFGWIEYKPPKFMYYAYLIGALITLNCAYRWFTNKEKK